jgi:hypothetical protein
MPIEIIKYDTVKAALKKDKPEPKMTLKKVFHSNKPKINKNKIKSLAKNKKSY